MSGSEDRTIKFKRTRFRNQASSSPTLVHNSGGSSVLLSSRFWCMTGENPRDCWGKPRLSETLSSSPQ